VAFKGVAGDNGVDKFAAAVAPPSCSFVVLVIGAMVVRTLVSTVNKIKITTNCANHIFIL